MDKNQKQFEYEREWLRLIIRDSTLWQDKTITLEHFYHGVHEGFYELLDKMMKDGNAITPLAFNTLSNQQIHTLGGKENIQTYLHYEDKPSLDTLKMIEKEIQTYHIGQSIINSVRHLPKVDTYELEDLRNVAQQINQVVDGVGSRRKSFNQLLVETHDRWMNMTDEMSGIPTGYASLDAAFDGWQLKNLIIVGARPSMGKTALTVNFFLKSAMHPNVMTSYFPAETGDESILRRSIAVLGGLPVNKMNNPMKFLSKDEKVRYHKTINELNQMNLNIDATGDIREIRQIARERTRKYPNMKHLFVLDHLMNCRDGQKYASRTLEFESYCQQLKDLAVEFNIAFMLLSQLSRGVEQRENKRPQNSDLRDSGSIEAIADQIFFIYRDSYYSKEQLEKDPLELLITKNRDGSVGTRKLFFLPSTNRVVEE